MRKILVVFLTAFMTVVYACADTLAVFKSNTIAKSAEVNANFALLNARIDSLVSALATADALIAGQKTSTALHDSLEILRSKVRADSAALAAADSVNQLAKGTAAAFLIAPGADGYLPGSNSAWLFAAGQGEKNGVTVPDMRGRFLRGIDYTITGHPATGIDPDGERTSGSAQTDAMQGHKHYTAIQEPVDIGGGGGYSVAFDRRSIFAETYPTSSPVADSANGTPRIAKETRPVNMAVYWYVKVK
jgi:hypothetical protein